MPDVIVAVYVARHALRCAVVAHAQQFLEPVPELLLRAVFQSVGLDDVLCGDVLLHVAREFSLERPEAESGTYRLALHWPRRQQAQQCQTVPGACDV